MGDQTMTSALVPFDGESSEPRRSLLSRVFGSSDAQTEEDKLRGEYNLLRLSIALSADLTRRERQAENFLVVSELEDTSAMEVTKVLKCRELCESIEDIFATEPMLPEVLKVRVRAIFNGRPETTGHQANHNGRHGRKNRPKR
jgi:hypothetical protein